MQNPLTDSRQFAPPIVPQRDSLMLNNPAKRTGLRVLRLVLICPVVIYGSSGAAVPVNQAPSIANQWYYFGMFLRQSVNGFKQNAWNVIVFFY
jgi:hypothetical protein